MDLPTVLPTAFIPKNNSKNKSRQKHKKQRPNKPTNNEKKRPPNPKPQALRFPLKDRPDGGFRGKEKEEGKNAESLTARGFAKVLPSVSNF